MTANNPSNMVTVIAEEDTTIVTNTGCIQICKGEEATISKAHYAHCAETVTVKNTDYCEDKQWLISIDPKTAWKAEVPATDGTPSSVCIKACACFLFSYGTEENPLVIPEIEAELKENTPQLLEEGEHTISLVQDGCRVNAIAIINCTDSAEKFQVTWKGCVR